MEWDTIRFEKDGQVGFLILDRPASLNAVNEQLIADSLPQRSCYANHWSDSALERSTISIDASMPPGV